MDSKPFATSFRQLSRRIAAIAVPMLFTVGAAFGHDASHVCEDRSVTAAAVQTREDVEAYVKCAYAFVESVGEEEAYRAFHEDVRWRSGPMYIFVASLVDNSQDAVLSVHPARPDLEGRAFGPSPDRFGEDFLGHLIRTVQINGEGWAYYEFSNPATGVTELKMSYMMEINWDGVDSFIGAGLYVRDVPGTCDPSEVNASMVDSTRSDLRLQEFVRCASYVLDSQGYLAMMDFRDDERWISGSVYVFALDMMGNQVFSGIRRRVNGVQLHEFGGGSDPLSQFNGRDMVAMANDAGEAFITYEAYNWETGDVEAKSGYLKRVVAQGVPLVVGAGYIIDPSVPDETPSCADNRVTAESIRTRENVRSFVQCAAEYIAEHGTEKASMDFRESGPWLSQGNRNYLWVNGLGPTADTLVSYVFPPRQSQEGLPLAPDIDDYGTDLIAEFDRTRALRPNAWVHYSITNYETGRIEPKASYAARVMWDGEPAEVGSGIYQRDVPGACRPEEVNAAALEASASSDVLQEFVRCAAYQVESLGLFAGPLLSEDPRWKHGSIYVFGIDGNNEEIIFSGSPSSFAVSGNVRSLFDGRDLVRSTVEFGEAFWYYDFVHPVTGMTVRKNSYAKSVVLNGRTIVVGSGHYFPGRER